MKPEDEYKEAKYVIEHPDEYHPGLVSEAKDFIRGYEGALALSNVNHRRELLIAFANYCEREWNCTEVPIDVIDEYLESN